MGPIWVLYGQESLYGAPVRPECDKCPDSAHMGPIYTCLQGSFPVCGSSNMHVQSFIWATDIHSLPVKLLQDPYYISANLGGVGGGVT